MKNGYGKVGEIKHVYCRLVYGCLWYIYIYILHIHNTFISITKTMKGYMMVFHHH